MNNQLTPDVFIVRYITDKASLSLAVQGAKILHDNFRTVMKVLQC